MDAGKDAVHLGNAEGLSNNYIMGIAQDRNGFIWVSTESGLNRFDGSRFKSFKKNSAKPESSIAANELNRIHADCHENVLWIATQRYGLDRLDCDTYQFTHYHKSDDPAGIGSESITSVTNSADGNLWVTTYTDGLDYFDKTTEKFSHFNSRTVKGWPGDQLWSAADDGHGNIYLGHVNDGLSVFTPASMSVKNYRHDRLKAGSLPGDKVRCVFIDRSRNIWVGTDAGLALFNPETGHFTTFRHNENNPGSLISDAVYDITQTDDGHLWIATENGGVSILDLKDALMRSPDQITFTNINVNPHASASVSNKTVHCIFQDSFGNIFVGTYGDGIDVFCHRRLPFMNLATDTPPPFNISYEAVMSLCSDADNLYIGTDGGGLDIFTVDGRAANLNLSNSALTDNAIIAAMRAHDGRIWLGTYSGEIAIYDPKAKKLSRFPLATATDVRCFTETADGRVIIGHGYGITIHNPADGSTKDYLHRDGKLREEWVRSLMADDKGRLWVGSFGHGLSLYDPQMKLLRRYDTSDGLPSNTVSHIIADPDGNIWAATGDGLVKIDSRGNILRVYTGDDGLADSNLKALARDSAGNIFISSSLGISVIDPATGKISNYGIADGIAGGDFSGGCVTTAVDGTILFGSHYGVYYFNPGSISNDPTPHSVAICDIKAYGDADVPVEEIHFTAGGTVRLPHDKNTFKVTFNVLDASLAPLIDYSCNLHGFDNRWEPASGNDGITFRNIPPGEYKVVIRSKLRNYETAETVTEIPVIIEPPLWATWWAKLAYLVAAICITLYVITFYKKRLALEYALTLERQNSSRQQELNAERMRFFTNITHELRTPLTLILGPLEDLKADKSLPVKFNKKISLIHKSAAILLELINTILEFRKTETQNRQLKVSRGDISAIIREIGLRYGELNTNGNLRIVTTIDDGDYNIWFDRDIVYMIVDNLMSNACKYTDKGVVELSLSHTEESGVPFTEISVRDTGLGMSTDALPRIFDRYYRDKGTESRLGTGIGLALVYNLVKLHNGEIFVDSELHKGSTFRFRLHTDSTYPDAAKKAPDESKAEADTAEARPEEGRTGSTDSPTVLVVDDNTDITAYIREVLSCKYSVVTAVNGADGLAKAREHGPEVIITDIMMPEMDGIAMVKSLKTDIETSHIPVIIITAKSSSEAKMEAYEAGADSFITKPFSSSLLLTRISNLLEMRHRLSARLLAAKAGRQTPGSDNDTAITDADGIILASLSRMDADFLKKVEEIIKANIADDALDVQFISDKMFMSHSTLYRKVKAATGMSVNGLIRKLRAREAGNLLLTGKHTVSEVAFMVGMGTPSNFRQCFKEEFGISPSEFLKNAKTKRVNLYY